MSLRKAEVFNKNNKFNKSIENYLYVYNNTDNKDYKISAGLGLIDVYTKISDYKNAYKFINEIEKQVDEPFKEWVIYKKIIVEYNLKSYIEAYNNSLLFKRKYPDSEFSDSVQEYAELSLALLDKSVDISKLVKDNGTEKQENKKIERIKLNITDYFKDDFGYVNINGVTLPNIKVKINDEETKSDENGKFSYKINVRWGKPIVIKAVKSENAFAVERIEDTLEPDEPEGLEKVSSNSNSVTVRWLKNDEEDLYGYNIYYREGSGSWIKYNRDDEIIRTTRYTVSVSFDTTKDLYISVTALDKLRNESDKSDELEYQWNSGRWE
jgi:hypothetical protein